ncbi:MAG TPA: potassium transporter TrkG [Nitrososphaeraceae archaeon]|nr:potassium transporter TrkG [Nitrososphaeraceae archaeon]
MVEPLGRPVSLYVSKQFVMVDENVSVAEAVKLAQPRNIETIIVTSNKNPIGIVTDSDILEKVVIKGDDSDLVFLKNIMSSPIMLLNSTSSVKQAIELMRIYKIKRVPIIDSQHKHDLKIIGIVTQKSLAEMIRNSVIEKTFTSYRVTIKENYRPIFGNLGFILQFAGILMIVPAILGTSLKELESAAAIYLSVISISLTGYIMNTLGEKSPLNLKQSSIVVVSCFLLLSLYGCLPYIYINPFEVTNDYLFLFVNSFLESSSGFTTTGISLIDEPESLPDSLVFYRSYSQWVGALSFVYLIMSLYYPETRLAAMRNVMGSAMQKFKQLLSTISIIFVLYTSFIILLIYFLGNIDLIDSLALSFATFSTGGFSPHSNIFSTINLYQLSVIMVGMIIAALPFGFYYGIIRKEVKSKRLSREIIVFLCSLLFFAVIFLITQPIISSDDFLKYIFQIISASTTTGFQFIDLSSLSIMGKIILIIVMLIGATAFSAASGIKIARILLILQKIKNSSSISPPSDANIPLSISSTAIQFHKNKNDHKQKLFKLSNKSENKHHFYNFNKNTSLLFSDKAFREAIFVIVLFILVSFLSAIAISFLSKSNFIDALFETSSTLSNTGLTVGVTTLDLDIISKLIISANMILGRFEIITLLYIFISKLR